MSSRRLVALVVTGLLAAATGGLGAAAPASAAGTRSAMVSWAQSELGNSGHNHGITENGVYNCNYYTGHFNGHQAGCPSGWHGGDWCADFVHYIWQLAGGVSGLTAINGYAESFKTYGVHHGTWHTSGSGYTPQPGDAIVYPDDNGNGIADHVGIVISASGGSVTTIEGNTGSAATHRYTVSISSAEGFTAPVFSGTTKVRDSIGVYRGSDARFYLDYNYDGSSEHQISYGGNGDVPISGNWDGIAGDGLGLYRPSTGTFYLDDNNDGVTDEWVTYGAPGDLPVAGNWDGRGSNDGIGVFRGATAHFYLDENNDGVTDHSFAYGAPGDLPVAGDWDGNGTDTVGVFRPSTGMFYLDNNNDGVTDVWVSYGTGGDLPVAGDWDGNGTDGIGVFRPSEGRFYLDANLDGATDYYDDYGAAGDRPLSRTVG